MSLENPRQKNIGKNKQANKQIRLGEAMSKFRWSLWMSIYEICSDSWNSFHS